MHITIAYNDPQRQPYGEKQDIISEKAVLQEVHDIKNALTRLKHTVTLLPLYSNVHPFIQELVIQKPDCVFNLCESVYGFSLYEMNVPALYEMIGLPYTGASPLSLGLCLDKIKTNYLLQGAGLSTPDFISTMTHKISNPPPFPLIVKPSREDGSRGISSSSLVFNKAGLHEKVKHIIEKYHQSALVEQYIEGRELNIALIGNVTPQIIGISEIDFQPNSKTAILTYKSKWEETSREYINTPFTLPSKINSSLRQEIIMISQKAYRVLGCQGYARIDFRVDKNNHPYIIDVNPNPDISQKAGFARSAEESGLPYTRLVKKIVNLALQNKPTLHRIDVVRIRKIEKKDIPTATRILKKVRVFRRDEVKIAKEIINTSLRQTTKRDYLLYVADFFKKTVGYICFGKTPLTKGTYDIYWLVVDPHFQNQGIGAYLLRFAEDYVKHHQGRKIIIETSSKKEYEPTRAFYASMSYKEVAKIKNFYSPEDDKCIYEKDLI